MGSDQRGSKPLILRIKRHVSAGATVDTQNTPKGAWARAIITPLARILPLSKQALP